jgi:hypothetical protein
MSLLEPAKVGFGNNGKHRKTSEHDDPFTLRESPERGRLQGNKLPESP